MRLLPRVIRLEGRAKAPNKPVHIVFQKIDESNEELACRTGAKNYDPESTLIVVKFIAVS